ncbi:hypothetical protein [Myxococcus sp. CA018]|uniref:hypothetical protein n=1 Tax=Myxococcus sp. CA018 TaxID=2651864 RepID=UPI0013DCA495|nr:hypothetical protein [Myxococcus sp. CA018]NOK05615.1 hypothetical protein [Myxococcus xanthus]
MTSLNDFRYFNIHCFYAITKRKAGRQSRPRLLSATTPSRIDSITVPYPEAELAGALGGR